MKLPSSPIGHDLNPKEIKGLLLMAYVFHRVGKKSNQKSVLNRGDIKDGAVLV